MSERVRERATSAQAGPALLDDALLSVMIRLVTGGVLGTSAARGEPPRLQGGPVPRVEGVVGAAHDAARVEVGAGVLGVVARFDLIALRVTGELRGRELLGAIRVALRPGGTFVAVEDAAAELLDHELLADSGFRDVTVARIDGEAARRYTVAR